MSVRPYNSKLNLQYKSHELINDTFDFIETSRQIALNFLISLYGGVDISMKNEMIRHNKSKRYKDQESDKFYQNLICAQNWFRLLPISIENLAHSVEPNEINLKFKKHHKKSNNIPKDEMETIECYFNGNFDDEKYFWVDCRAKYLKLEKDLDCNLYHDVKCLIREGILPILNKQKALDISSLCSNMFGDGEKENRKDKSLFTNKFKEIIINAKVKTKGALKKLILNEFNSENREQLLKCYFGTSRGRPPIFITGLWTEKSIIDEKINNEDFNEEFKDKLIKLLNSKIDDKSQEMNLPNKNKIKNYLESKIGIKYDLNIWSQIFNCLSDIFSKNSLNYNFSIDSKERLENINLLEKEVEKEISILNGFFDSKYYEGEKFNVYTIKKKHVYGIKDLFKIWSEGMNCEEGIEEIKSEDDNKYINIPLMKYLYNFHKDISHDKLLDAAKYNHLLDEHKRQKVNPIVLGNQGILYGNNNSCIRGEIINPYSLDKNSKTYNGKKTNIPFSIDVYDKKSKSFQKINLSFENIRYSEEVYSINDEKVEKDAKGKFICSSNPQRNIHFNNKVGKFISKENRDKFNEIKIDKTKKQIQSLKRTLRVQENINIKENIKWNDPSFSLAKEKDEFYIIIHHKVEEIAKKDKYKFENGSITIGLDKNQTTPDFCAILKYTKDDKSTIKTKLGSVDIIYSSAIESKVYSKNKYRDGYIDQLSYEGNPIKIHEKFIKNSEEIYLSLFNKEYKNKCENLYPYLYNFTFSVKKSLKEIDKSKLPQLRNLILNISNIVLKLGSLSRFSLDALKNTRAITNSYLNKLFNLDKKEEQKATIDELKKCDLEIFELNEKIQSKFINKRLEKHRRNSSELLTISKNYNVNHIAAEGGLNNMKTKKECKKGEKFKNNRITDWGVKKSSENLSNGIKLTKINLDFIDPAYTSHIDLEGNSYCRFDKIDKSQIDCYHLTSLSKILSSKLNSKKMNWYKEEVENFIKFYGLEEYKIYIKNYCKNKGLYKEIYEEIINKIKLNNSDSIFIPNQYGGRYALLNKKYDNLELLGEFNYNGIKYIYKSDAVAPARIALDHIVKNESLMIDAKDGLESLAARGKMVKLESIKDFLEVV